MKKLIPKIIDLICFIGGSVLLIYNLLYILYPKTSVSLRRISYPYEADDLFGYRIGLLLGLGLIVLGFLIRTWRKDKTKN